ncbi:MAG: beta-lactamase family protein [Treponema sp.]|jgi:CubicO group peptidase (beta-lactamase class C family)|nr:beta-lactamase family protein [Treponema sp.]
MKNFDFNGRINNSVTLNQDTVNLIKKAVKGKKYIKLNIGIMAGGQTIIKTFGENGEIDYENNVYEIGSITKTFTASLMAKYISQDQMRLNDPINKYIPGLDPDKYYPSLQRIATHTAGYSAIYPLSNWEFAGLGKDLLFGKGKTQQENPFNMDFNKMLELIQKSKLKDRDYKWKYSNFGISLLGYAIGSVSGCGYWDTMTDFLANDLELKNTYLGTVSNKNLKGFNSKNEDCGNWQWDKDGTSVSCGGLSSTAEDLLAYARANMYEEKNYLALCHKKYASASKKNDMGLAWGLDKKNNNIMDHQGGTGCFSSTLVIDKEKKTAVVLLSNYRLAGLEVKIGTSILDDITFAQ